ncbi:MAG: hypothetical protein ACODAE_02975 [Gemmatimonadota bacterium]
MPAMLRGALIEYGSDFFGPIPNVVIFQFNPESLSREIQIPERPTGASSREASQAGEVPVEKFTITAHFSAADRLNDNHPLARAVGIGPQLAALEKMVRPAGRISSLIGAAVDAAGDLLGGGEEEATQPIPREAYPRTLLIWGVTRVLPVIIESLTIDEQEYDFLLNPVRAEVSIGMSVSDISACTDDVIARGALEYSNLAKEAQAMANLANTVEDVIEIIPF